MATITYQNYFRMYRKLSGMTGTAKTEEEEFREIYNMNVIAIPTNRSVQRIDGHDLIYPSLRKKNSVGGTRYQTTSRGRYNQSLSVRLLLKQVNCYLTTTRRRNSDSIKCENHFKEAEIIMSAGQRGAVTPRQTWLTWY